MIKLTIIGTLIYPVYQYPTHCLLLSILAIIILDLIQRLNNKEHALDLQYEGVKEIFNNPNSTDYIEPKVTDTKLEVVPVNINLFSYRELQVIAKRLGITGRNRKRLILEQELLAVCK